MTEKTIASKKCTIFPDENATVCLVQPVDERESALLEKQVGEIKRLTDKPFVMAAFLTMFVIAVKTVLTMAFLTAL